MRKWTMMTIFPLALAMTAGCSDAGEKKASERAATVGASGTRDFALNGFTGVEVAGPDDVTIRQGNAFSISATGPADELDRLAIERDGATLSIGRKREGFRFGGHDSDGVRIAITMPRLDSVRLTGSGSIDADKVEGDTVAAVVTGSGDLKIAALTGTRADISISGSGGVEIASGTVKSAEMGVTGSGDIEAAGLTAETLDISVTGSGDVDAKATASADISILGSGDVTVGGGAKCSTHAMGSGTATCK